MRERKPRRQTLREGRAPRRPGIEPPFTISIPLQDLAREMAGRDAGRGLSRASGCTRPRQSRNVRRQDMLPASPAKQGGAGTDKSPVPNWLPEAKRATDGPDRTPRKAAAKGRPPPGRKRPGQQRREFPLLFLHPPLISSTFSHPSLLSLPLYPPSFPFFVFLFRISSHPLFFFFSTFILVRLFFHLLLLSFFFSLFFFFPFLHLPSPSLPFILAEKKPPTP